MSDVHPPEGLPPPHKPVHIPGEKQIQGPGHFDKPPANQFSEDEMKKMMNGICNTIAHQIQKESARMVKAIRKFREDQENR